MLRWTIALWLMGVTAFTGAAALDVVANLGWGYDAKDIWGGVLMIAGGCLAWAFLSIVNSLVLAISRRLYGPEPGEPTK